MRCQKETLKNDERLFIFLNCSRKSSEDITLLDRQTYKLATGLFGICIVVIGIIYRKKSSTYMLWRYGYKMFVLKSIDCLVNRVTRQRTGWRDYLMKHSTPGSHQKKFDLNRSPLHLSLNRRKFQFIDRWQLASFSKS